MSKLLFIYLTTPSNQYCCILLKSGVVLIHLQRKLIPLIVSQKEFLYSNLLCEKLHLKFCKSILGLHKSTTDFAVQSELGRFPLHFDILRSMLSYWHRLENFGQSFPLLYNAYLESNLLFQQNTSSWYGSINFFLLNVTGI